MIAPADVPAALAAARERLHGVTTERLGVRHEPRRLLGLGPRPRISPVGAAWHLGVLLLTEHGIAATGEILRARHEAIRGFTAASQSERDALAAAARRGGFEEGEIVHLGWHGIDLDEVTAGRSSEPLSVAEGGVWVRWSAAGARMPLDRYLDERVELVVHPPERA